MTEKNTPKLDPLQTQAIDAIVNGMLDAQAAGELHLLEQLRRMSLHAGPAFDNVVQARLAQQERMLAELAVQDAPDVTTKVLGRVRAESIVQKHDRAVAAEARAAALVRVHEQNREAKTHAPKLQEAFVGPVPPDASESQGGRPVRSVHHRRRLVSSTALAFLAGGVVTLALVTLMLVVPPASQQPVVAQNDSPLIKLTPALPLTLSELEQRAYFDPTELPMIEEPAIDTRVRLGNAAGFDQLDAAAFASGAGSATITQMRAQFSLPTSSVATSSDSFQTDRNLLTSQLSPLQQRKAFDLMQWGLVPWGVPSAQKHFGQFAAPISEPAKAELKVAEPSK